MQSDFALVIEKRPVKNFWKGRGGFLPIAIVERMMQGSIEDAEQYFNGRSPEGVFAVSAHYGVARDGRVWQFVADEDTAWSNGVLQNPDLSIGWLKEVYQEKVNCNLVTLSVDYEGYSGESLTPRQYEAALALHRQLVQRWEIEADNQHIIGHNWIDSLERSHNPGPLFPFSQLIKDLHTTPSEVAQPPVQPNLLAFLETPLPDAEPEVPATPAAEAEPAAAYQPEPVEEPPYSPQLEAFTFTPDLNEEFDQPASEPVEVEPASAEPVDAETASAEPGVGPIEMAQGQPEEVVPLEPVTPVSTGQVEEALPEETSTAPEMEQAVSPVEETETQAASPAEEIESPATAAPQEEFVQPEEPQPEPAAALEGEATAAEAVSPTGIVEEKAAVPSPDEVLAEPAGLPFGGEEEAATVSSPEEVLSEPAPSEDTSEVEAASPAEETPSEPASQFEDFDLTDIEAALAYQPKIAQPAPVRQSSSAPTQPAPVEEAAENAVQAETSPEAQPELASQVEEAQPEEVIQEEAATLAQAEEAAQPEEAAPVAQSEEIIPEEATPVSQAEGVVLEEAAQPEEVISEEAAQPEEAAPADNGETTLETLEPEAVAAEPGSVPENQLEVFDAPGQPAYLAEMEAAPFAEAENAELTATEPDARLTVAEPGAELPIQPEPAEPALEEALPEEALPAPAEDTTAVEVAPVEVAESALPTGEPAGPEQDDWTAGLFEDEALPGFEEVATQAPAPESSARSAAPKTGELEVSPAIGDDITPIYSRPPFFDASYTYEPTPVELTSLDEDKVGAEPVSEGAAEPAPVAEAAVEAMPVPEGTSEVAPAEDQTAANPVEEPGETATPVPLEPAGTLEEETPTEEPSTGETSLFASEAAAEAAEVAPPPSEEAAVPEVAAPAVEEEAATVAPGEAAQEPAQAENTVEEASASPVVTEVPAVPAVPPPPVAETPVAPEKPEEKQHWYNRLFSIFGGHDNKGKGQPEQPAAPVESPTQALENPVQTGPAESAPVPVVEESQALSNQPEAYQPDYAAEQTLFRADGSPAPGTIEAAIEPARFDNVTTAQPSVTPFDFKPAPEEAQPEKSVPGSQPEITLEPVQESASAVSPPEVEPTRPETAPVEAPTETTPSTVPAESAPVEESFYPFELDTPGSSNYAAYYQSGEAEEQAGTSNNFNFDLTSFEEGESKQVSSYPQDNPYGGPSDYPFELPAQEPSTNYFQSFAPSTSPAAEPQPETVIPPFSLEPEKTADEPSTLFDTAPVAAGHPQFAADDLELPAWLDEPATPAPELAESGSEAASPAEPTEPAAASSEETPSDFAWAGNSGQEEELPGWLQAAKEDTGLPDWLKPATSAVEPTVPAPESSSASQPVQPPVLRNDPAVEIPNKDWLENENLFEDEDFFSLLNQSGLDLSLERGGTGALPSTDNLAGSPEPVSPLPVTGPLSATPPEPESATPAAPVPSAPAATPPDTDFDNYFDEVEPTPSKVTVRQLIDRNDGYTAPLSYEDLDMSVPMGLEEDITMPGTFQPAPPASAPSAPEVPPRPAPPGFHRVDLGKGQTSVELANIRTVPSYDKNTVVRISEEGERFEFDGWIEGPELRGSTRWYRIVTPSGDQWIHSTLVQLDRPFRG